MFTFCFHLFEGRFVSLTSDVGSVWTSACFTPAFRSAGGAIKEKHPARPGPAQPGPGLLPSIRMFWKNIAWSWGDSVGDDDDDDGGAYLLAADIRKTPDVSPAADLNCSGATSSSSLSKPTSTTAAGPDQTKVQSPVRSPALIEVNHQRLQGDSNRSSFGSGPYTTANREAKGKSNQLLLVSHMTQVTRLLYQDHQRSGVTCGLRFIGRCHSRCLPGLTLTQAFTQLVTV